MKSRVIRDIAWSGPQPRLRAEPESLRPRHLGSSRRSSGTCALSLKCRCEHLEVEQFLNHIQKNSGIENVTSQ
jgi:hypothetical protein